MAVCFYRLIQEGLHHSLALSVGSASKFGLCGQRCIAFALLLSSTASIAVAEQVQMEEVGHQEQVSSPIDYVNTSILQTSEVKLVTRGIAGTPGAVFTQKVGPGSGGDINFDNGSSITLVDSPAKIILTSTGPDSLAGSTNSNFSAQPGSAGAITFKNSATIKRRTTDLAANDYLVSILTRPGNWSTEGLGYTAHDDRNGVDLQGRKGADVSIVFDHGTVQAGDGGGIVARTIGGMGAGKTAANRQGFNYAAGAGGTVTLVMSRASVTATGAAVSLYSEGAYLDRGGEFDVRPGGDGGTVTAQVSSQSKIQTSGPFGHGLVVRSLGGDRSNSGGGTKWFAPTRETGSGGSGGDVTVSIDSTSLVTTEGELSYGVFAQSSGGGGAKGIGEFGLIAAAGRDGGRAGDGGHVHVRNEGVVKTDGKNAIGIFAGGIGGGRLRVADEPLQTPGGAGGAAIAVLGAIQTISEAGDGGAGGSGPRVVLEQLGAVSTQGDQAIGVLGSSIGGNGGEGGMAFASAVGVPIPIPGTNGKTMSVAYAVAIGGSGGAGGDGGDVVYNTNMPPLASQATPSTPSRVSTAGINSAAVRLLSTGGGGGSGGSSIAVAGAIPADYDIGVATSLGGQGGGGGQGGSIVAQNAGVLETKGLASAGLLASSTGGGGGAGGFSLAAYLDLVGKASTEGTGSASSAVGGSGGEGGDGGTVQITNDRTGMISTEVDNSPTVYASSVGGGGGRGGDSVGLGFVLQSDAVAVGAAIGIGGSGGQGGDGGNVTVTNKGTLSAGTTGLATYSSGIFAQSVGGGGGEGGVASSVTLDLVKAFLGFTDLQKEAGKRGVVTVGATQTTRGAEVGGSKPKQGVEVPKSLRVNLAVGGTGGGGGHGASVTVRNEGTVATYGANSAAIFAQSVGGGGGIGKGTFSKQTLNSSWTGEMQFGGDGGVAGNGGRVGVDNTGLLTTERDGSPGVFAQSIGGGGGKGGSDNIEGINPELVLKTLGEATGWVKTIQEIKKTKDKLFPATSADTNAGKSPDPKPIKLSFALSMGVGGAGGAAGDGGSVRVSSSAPIQTKGDLAPGIFAQSIGGGGGQGGTGLVSGKAASITGDGVYDAIKDIRSGDGLKSQNAVNNLLSNVTNSLGANIAVGGDGGAKGNGGEVSALIESDVVSKGRHAPGVMLQSIGGGGGQGASAQDNSSGLLRLNFRFGGDGSQTGGHGGKISIRLGDKTPARVQTTGDYSPGVRMQSIGGGGGTAELMAADFYEHFDQGVRQANQVDADVVAQAFVDAMQGKDIVNNKNDGKSKSDLEKALSASGTVRGYLDKAMKADAWGLVQQIGKDAELKGIPKSLVDIGYSSPGNGASGGHGGDVSAVLEHVTIVTQGMYSPGLSAWSIGGGGGLATTPTGNSLLNLVHTSSAINGTSGDGGNIDISLGQGAISTDGDRSYGIEAQTIGGGGGYIGEADILAVSTDQASAADDQTSGDGGKITIGSQDRLDISTRGNYAHGIFAVSAGGGFGAVGVSDGLVVLNDDVSGGRAGDLDLTYRGNLTTSGEGSVGVLAVTSGVSDHRSQMDVTLSGATVQTANDSVSAGIGLIGRQARYQITLADKTRLLNPSGFAVATLVALTQSDDTLKRWSSDSDYTWAEIGTRTSPDFNTVKVTGGSTLSGNVTLSGATKLIIDDKSNWYPGQHSIIGSSGGVSTPQWSSPVKFASLGNKDWTYSALPVALDQPGQVIVEQGATLNPGGTNQFLNSRIYIGAPGDKTAQLWLAGESTLEIDIGHTNGQVVHDQLTVNLGTDQLGDLVAGGARESGGYNLKIRLLGLRGVTGKEMVIAQTSSRIMRGKLVQPLVVTGHNYEIRSAQGGGEQMVYQVDSVRFDREQMSGFSRSIARQMDEALAQGNYQKESSMVAALAYYAGQEADYEKQMHELAENGNALDVLGRRMQGLFVQNFLHSCQAFVGQGLGLVEENCTYARVTGTDVSMSASGASEAQDISGSQIALGGQRRIGQGLFAGFLFGLGQASADSTDGEYRSSNQSLSVGAVIKKRFAEKYEVALSGTYSRGWSDSNRFINSSLEAPAYLSGSTKDNEAGVRLRLAYYGTTDTFYVKPYVDFDARYYQSDAWTESGDSPFAMNYPSMSFWTYTATPMLEVGTRIDTKGGVWRAFVSGGVALSNDDKQTMMADFTATNGGAPIEMQWEATPTMGIVNVGAEYVGKDNSFFTLTYEGMFGDGVRQSSLMARVGLRF